MKKLKSTATSVLLLFTLTCSPAVFCAPSSASTGLPPISSSLESNKTKETDERIDVLYGHHDAYHRFLKELQQYVSDKNQEKISELVAYPIKVKIKSVNKTIRDKKEFIENYEKILTPKILKVISDQKYENLFVNYEGIMIGNGEIWFSGVCKNTDCKEIKITAINTDTH